MDSQKVADLLQATMEHNNNIRKEAEKMLMQVQKIIGLSPTLLQIIISNDPIPIRQVAVVYFKNLFTQNWQARDAEEGEPAPFVIHEQDKAIIRDAIIDVIVQVPDIIAVQLCICLRTIIKHDFPNKWTQIVDKIHIYLQNQDSNNWNGALMCLYQLIKNYEDQTSEQRVPLIETMNLLLPRIYNLMISLMPDPSEQSALIQKQILKCFYCLIKNNIPRSLIDNKLLSSWMEIIFQVLKENVPENNVVTDDERMKLPWWKCKKWAIHILYRLYENYGNPANVNQNYLDFAEWYRNTYIDTIEELLLNILEQYDNKIYISPLFLDDIINYLDRCMEC